MNSRHLLTKITKQSCSGITTQYLAHRCLLLGLAAILSGVSISAAYGQKDEWADGKGGSGSIFPLDVGEQGAFLKAHNDARAQRGLQPLTWSNDIARYADLWLSANKEGYQEALRKGQPPSLKHRPDNKYGENLACAYGAGGVSTQAVDAVTMWLKEKDEFDQLNSDPQNPYVVRANEAFSGPACVIHYTQIIWKNTKQIGAAKYIDTYVDNNNVRHTMVIIICNYDPKGNFIGQKPF